VGYALLVVGTTLVVASTYRLGITGTYLGDYFGILMDAPVTTWPFSWLSSPMYVGSTCSFLGWALVKGTLAGAALTGLVAIMYVVALRFEELVKHRFAQTWPGANVVQSIHRNHILQERLQ
jgi:phosphatidylethanolamine/phosphatidyl-N-methylethanolamine N-methyltransferase